MYSRKDTSPNYFEFKVKQELGDLLGPKTLKGKSLRSALRPPIQKN